MKNAFVYTEIDKEIYVIQPKGFEKGSPQLVCRLKKALYGLKQSPRLWYIHLKSVLAKQGFDVFLYNEGVFIYREKGIIIACHVDDFIITGPNNKEIKTIVTAISSEIKLQYIGKVSNFLGNEIIIDKKEKSLFIYQKKYTRKILQQYDKTGSKPVGTPFEAGVKLRKAVTQASQTEIRSYQQQIGSLLYLALKTRPDITFAVSKCSRYMVNPDLSHFKALDRIWAYLNKYPDLGLKYQCDAQVFLKVYSDSDWASSLEDKKSTSAFVSMLNTAPINWEIKL